jgi:hypothetical protein
MDELRNDFERAEYLVNLLLSAATGKDRDERGFKALRSHFLADATLQPVVPDWLRTCRTLDQFWPFIQRKFPHYAERREFIWAEFGPLLGFLEKGDAPAIAAINAELLDFSEGGVHDLWRKALERMLTPLAMSHTGLKNLSPLTSSSMANQKSFSVTAATAARMARARRAEFTSTSTRKRDCLNRRAKSPDMASCL